ncbi:MAG: sigma-70 family RNA polymerase sigma factor [Cyclobacteriaceae bacterium]
MRSNASDQELISAIVDGNSTAINMLIDRHKQYAFTLSFRILNNREEAEEASHDAFLKALKSLANYRSDAKFTTWFYRIVVNTAISRKRKMKVYLEDIDDVHHQGSFAISDKSLLSEKERNHYISLALSKLNEIDATLITLYYFKEMSVEEIEGITGFDKNNIKVKMFRARKKLGEHLSNTLKTEVTALL